MCDLRIVIRAAPTSKHPNKTVKVLQARHWFNRKVATGADGLGCGRWTEWKDVPVMDEPLIVEPLAAEEEE